MLGIPEYVFGGTDKKRSRRKVIAHIDRVRLGQQMVQVGPSNRNADRAVFVGGFVGSLQLHVYPEIGEASALPRRELKIRTVVSSILLLDHKLSRSGHGMFERSLRRLGKFAVLIPNWKVVE